MALSIFHRVSGCALATGLLLLTWWLGALASGESAFAGIHGIVGNWFGGLVLFGVTVALFYHGCNGVRHLFWDAGYALSKEAAAHSGKMVLGATAVLTAITWIALLLA